MYIAISKNEHRTIMVIGESKRYRHTCIFNDYNLLIAFNSGMLFEKYLQNIQNYLKYLQNT